MTPPDRCDCPCHGPRGVNGDGYSYIWDDDRGIRHEDWVDCSCGHKRCTSRAGSDEGHGDE